MSGTPRLIAGEFRKMRKRPVTWVLCALALLEVLFFEYFIGYTTYLQEARGIVPLNYEPPRLLLASLLPGQVVLAVVGAGLLSTLAMVFGALIGGSEYGWGTFKTMLTAGPSRLALLSAQMVTLATAIAILVVVLFASALAASLLVEALQRAYFVWEPLWQFPAGMACEFLALIVPAVVAFLFATLTRSSALGIALAMTLFYVIEPAFEAFAFLSPVVQGAINWLPGANALSLLSLFGSQGGGPDTPTSGPANGNSLHFTVVLLLYLATALACAAYVVRHRDAV